MPTFEKLLSTLTQITIRARLHWDIWWAYEGEDESPKALPTMNRYSEFFRFDIHAHLTAMIIASYQLYEVKRTTHNLGVLVKRAGSEPGVPATYFHVASNLLRESEPLAAKVRILRNNAFGHRSLALGYEDAFEKAAITPFQLRDLTKTALDIVNQFHRALGDTDCDFNDAAIEHLRRLLDNLRDFHRTRRIS
ncbi:MAG TPA: hypothetical protein VMW27_16610 [Thermoanaerobaculia bacterium]|nr:hypothetical protein [Thermoanaerobaculia bacterium]